MQTTPILSQSVKDRNECSEKMRRPTLENTTDSCCTSLTHKQHRNGEDLLRRHVKLQYKQPIALTRPSHHSGEVNSITGGGVWGWGGGEGG